MAAVTVQSVVDSHKANPEYARQLNDYVTKYPDEAKAALQKRADAQGWGLSSVDVGALKTAVANLKWAEQGFRTVYLVAPNAFPSV